MIAAELRVGHPERRENILLREIAERLAGRALDNDREQEVTGVAVEEFRARREVQGFLARNQGERRLVRGHAIDGDAREREQRQVIANSAGVIQEVQNRDFPAGINRQLRNILANIIIELELALLRKKQNAGSGELLGG